MQVLCGQCRRTLQVDGNPFGAAFGCPVCGHEIVLHDERINLAVSDLVLEQPDEEQEQQEEAGYAEMARMAMSQAKRIAVKCGSCGKVLHVGLKLAGKKGRCPSCKSAIRIPYPDDELEFDIPPSFRQKPRENVAEVQEALSLPTERTVIAPPVAAGPAKPVGFTPAVIVKLSLLGALVLTLLVSLVIGLVLAVRGEPEQAPVVETPPVTPSTEIPPYPPGTPVDPAARYIHTTAGFFGPEGYNPAPPELVYWTITLEVQAGQQPLEVASHGSGATLVVGTRTMASLGAPNLVGGLLPATAVPASEKLPPGTARRLSFVFQAPHYASRGIMKLSGVGEIPIETVPTYQAPEPAALEGNYVEQPPRNLRPLLRDPVMRAVQSAQAHTLVAGPVRHAPADPSKVQSLDVAIPQAGVTGVAMPLGGGLFEAWLRDGDDRLRCKLRLIEGGRRLILYLSDQPFHSITYVKE